MNPVASLRCTVKEDEEERDGVDRSENEEKKDGREVYSGKQASKQASKLASKEGSKQASKQSGKQASSQAGRAGGRRFRSDFEGNGRLSEHRRTIYKAELTQTKYPRR
ncbi:hypothetical protein HZH66_006430 [Vespula vulgaris]|uniref:Uncharacterized protein n=1 Tax=Vespula vulgaris TaxID=7454 RepID=A0A834K1Q7_VESVU|nr:hypothetical protein HZH66_006430 [Vespula vulgaris]